MKFSREYLNLKPGSCFVIMPFGVKKLPDGRDFDWDRHYKEVISPVIAETGMTPTRSDDIYGTGLLMEQIWQGIQEAELIIADLTGRSPNVMYELGLAHVIWKRVILLTMNKEDVPFDLSPYPYVEYSDQGHELLSFTRKLKENLLAAQKEPKEEAILVPGGGIEKAAAEIIAVAESFATIQTGDGRRGFLNSEDVSWARGFSDLRKIYKVGDKVDGAFVLGPKGENRYSLIAGEENPWLKLKKEFPGGKPFSGQIVKYIQHTGAFVKMKYGINGLIPGDLIPPTETISKGDLVEAITVDINIEKRKIDLRFSRKLTSTEAPKQDEWNEYEEGQRFEGKVVKIDPNRKWALIKLPDGFTAMLHQAQMSDGCREKINTGEIEVGTKLEVEIARKDAIQKRLQLKDCS